MKGKPLTAQPKSNIRKAQILQAAERVFAQKGYQEATISDVARREEKVWNLRISLGAEENPEGTVLPAEKKAKSPKPPKSQTR
jgi:hypothetical protein